MNKEDIEQYLRMVGAELQKKNVTLDILLLDMAVMLIEVGNHKNIENIDTYFLPDYIAIPQAAAVVAKREGLADNWLSSAAAGFTYIFKKEPPTKLWRSFPGLNVYTAALEYVFVMKIMASRLKDEVDIAVLTTKLAMLMPEDVLTLVKQYVPEEYVTPDLMEEIKERFGRSSLG